MGLDKMLDIYVFYKKTKQITPIKPMNRVNDFLYYKAIV